MLGLKFAAGPPIALLELDSEKVIGLFEFTVFYAGLAAIALELKRDNGVGRNGFFEFQACTRCRYIFEDCPFAAGRPEFWFPLHFNQICAKFSIFSSFGSHD
jgi:hypothetical protein